MSPSGVVKRVAPSSGTPASETARTIAPRAVVARAGLYLRQLDAFKGQGVHTVSSRQLGEALNLGDAQVRKDLAWFGQFGHPGVGYDVIDLAESLRAALGLDRVWPVALVGVGNLGRALLRDRGFSQRGFQVECVFDKDPRLVGQRCEGFLVEPVERLAELLAARRIVLVVLCVPADQAQAVAHRAVEGGAKGILNFAPVALSLPPGVDVVPVDLSIHLERLAYHAHHAGR
ncbi:redox-sensing transcriptional repressor Rex [Isosphaera pallida]|uniref:redox-sensing transcriptional repressor Rex n=1 Tax=Isosphaera pallida TaxID=128 RepID=UPI0003149E0F|nr:redox-sensing transcriptional repressor Rex [Isosphaera pallida]